jgi:tight adherence protein B
MMTVLQLLKWGSLACIAIGIFGATFLVAADRHSAPYRYWALYVTRLERKLRNMFLMTRGDHVAVAQLAASALVAGLGLAYDIPFWWLTLAIIAVVPGYVIEHMRKERIKLIESKMDNFVLTLANALKTTPSIGNALLYAQPMVMPPMNQELALALKEVRVGNTVDQALLNMSSRIRSTQLDAALASILIGRQVGGDLPKILETTATTLREMSRLQGVLRAKTAEGKIQVGVLASIPAFLLIGFDTVKPGYFVPLTESVVGWGLVVAAVLLWLAALVVARQVLKVDI